MGFVIGLAWLLFVLSGDSVAAVGWDGMRIIASFYLWLDRSMSALGFFGSGVCDVCVVFFAAVECVLKQWKSGEASGGSFDLKLTAGVDFVYM